MLFTNLVALIWTFFKSLINPILYGFQTELAYSIWDLTIESYKASSDRNIKFLLIPYIA